MKWYKKLYAGESIAHKTGRVKWKIIHNAGQLHVYVITLASNEKNLLELIPSWEFMQKYYPKKHKMIIGLAGDYEEALLLVEQIIGEIYEKTGGFDVRSFFGEGASTQEKEDIT